MKTETFQELFQLTVDEAFQSEPLSYSYGFLLFAIDGTELALAPSDELKTVYYGRRYEGCKTRAFLLCDVTERLIIYEVLMSLNCSKRETVYNNSNYK